MATTEHDTNTAIDMLKTNRPAVMHSPLTVSTARTGRKAAMRIRERVFMMADIQIRAACRSTFFLFRAVKRQRRAETVRARLAGVVSRRSTGSRALEGALGCSSFLRGAQV